jgi:hypothetical protein
VAEITGHALVVDEAPGGIQIDPAADRTLDGGAVAIPAVPQALEGAPIHGRVVTR